MRKKPKPYIGGNIFLIKGVPHQFNGSDVEPIDITENYINLSGEECWWNGKTFTPIPKISELKQDIEQPQQTPEPEVEYSSTGESQMKEVFWFYVILYLSMFGLSYFLPTWLVGIILVAFSLWLLLGFLKNPNDRDYRGQDDNGNL